MERLHRRRRWHRWAGPLSDLGEAVEIAIATIKKASGSTPRCEIEVVWPTLTRTLETPESLEVRVQERDLKSITSIRMEVGEEQGAFVSIRASKTSPAISLEVKGDDDMIVDALVAQISDVLSRSSRRVPKELVIALAIVGGIAYVILTMAILPDVLDLPRGRRGNVDWSLGPILLALVPPMLFGLFMAWVVPAFELLGAGQVDRFRRFRIWIVGFVTAVVAGIVSALVVQ